MPGFGLDENLGLAYHRLMLFEPTEAQLSAHLDALPKLIDWAMNGIKISALDLVKR